MRAENIISLELAKSNHDPVLIARPRSGLALSVIRFGQLRADR